MEPREKRQSRIEGKKKNRFEANSKYASHCKEGDTVTIEVKGQEYKADDKTG